jgi:phosphodiesterase/alkaline phosphatase D-like protein
MLGTEQRAWLLDGLGGSTAKWKVVGSQLMFAPFRSFVRLPGQPVNGGVFFNLTQWDGYAAERAALLGRIAETGATNTLVLSGDSAGWVMRVALADREVVRVTETTPAEVELSAWPGAPLRGSITEIASSGARMGKARTTVTLL